MALKTVPDGYLSIRETFDRLFDAKFPEWIALASAGKSFEFGRPRDDPTVKLDLPEDRHFRHEREISDLIAEQFCNGDLAIFLHFTDGRTEPILPYELNVPFFRSRISDEDFGLGAIDGQTVCLRKSDVDKLVAQFTGRRRGRDFVHDWEAIKRVSDDLLSKGATRQGLAEDILGRLSDEGWDTVPDISTLRRKLNVWYGRK
jgi:hypothetical protein